MKPVKVDPKGCPVTEFAAPKDWDEAAFGPCGTLQVRREVTGNESRAFVGCFSNWKPDSDELARLNAGGVVELECCGSQPAVSLSVVACADPDAGPPARTMEAIRGAVARGWCHEGNTHKEMDSVLAESISCEVAALIGVAL